MYTDKKICILIALDYNATAQKIAVSGKTLAKAMNGEVVLLHVVASPDYDKTTRYFPEIRISESMGTRHQQSNNNDRSKKVTLSFLDKIKDTFGDLSIHIRVEEGDLAETILRTANAIFADLIVMGSHSNRCEEDILMGSVTEKVLLHSSIPLIIIPTKVMKSAELNSGKRKSPKTSLTREKFKEDYQ